MENYRPFIISMLLSDNRCNRMVAIQINEGIGCIDDIILAYKDFGLSKSYIIDFGITRICVDGGSIGTRKLNYIPDSVSILTYLRDINLRNNNIKTLPMAFNMSSLVQLNLENNNIDVFPEVLMNASSLQNLVLSQNNIQDIPNISTMINLRTLFLYDAKVSQDNIRNIRKNLPMLKVYF